MINIYDKVIINKKKYIIRFIEQDSIYYKSKIISDKFLFII